jgi:outer membrane lipase/esterase
MRYSKLCVSAIALGAALLATGASAQTYGRLVVFGDSLSDNGNLFRASGGTQPQSPPYAQRFSNGPVFTELLGFPNLQFFGATTGNVNNAFGGARTDIQANPPSLQVQLNAYLARGGRFGPDDLVTVYGGANDIFQAVQPASASPNPSGFLGGVSTTAANNVAALAGRIAGGGAGTVAVFNLPNLGTTPQFAGGPAAQLVDVFGSATFNTRLSSQVAAAAQANTGTNFIFVDVERANAAVRTNPGAFGFSNITTPCLNPATGAVCSAPDTFLYFDTVHPTAAGHRFLAAVTNDYLYYGARGAATAAQAETALDHRESALAAALGQLEHAWRRGSS